MNAKSILAACIVAVVLVGTGKGQVRLPGSRAGGTGLSRGAGSIGLSRGAGSTGSTPGNASELRGNERFLRENRRSTDFVGTDTRDRRDFIGTQQGSTSGRVESAQTGLRTQTGPDANRSQPPPTQSRRGMYQPRLRIDFAFARQPSEVVSSDLAGRLTAAAAAIRQASPIEVSVEGETATLRGTVASERDRALARLMMLFEPGIYEVRNELVVRALPRSAGESPTGRAPSPTAVRSPSVRAPLPTAVEVPPAGRRYSGPREF